MKKLFVLSCLLITSYSNATDDLLETAKEFNKTQIASGIKSALSGAFCYCAVENSWDGFKAFIDDVRAKRSSIKDVAKSGVRTVGMAYVAYLLLNKSWSYAKHALSIK